MGAARSIIHVDMDAFYAAVEQRDHPELRGRPVIVGARPGSRGVVSTASYEARRYGVHSAMPIGRAHRLCPHGVYLPPDHDKYAAVSEEIMALLRELTPLVEPVSIDEAFLDVTGSRSLFGDGAAIGAEIRRRIREAVALTASVGVAANKFVAKVASDVGKPDGLVVVPAGHEAAFLAPLPMSRLWGVGKVTAEELEALGLRTIGQLARLATARLSPRFGPGAEGLLALAHGRDDRPVVPEAPPKSMGAEETFERDVTDPGKLRATLRRQAERVARELRASGYAATTVTLKVRFADFSTLTRAHTGEPTQDGLTLYREAIRSLDRLAARRPVRLIGLSASGLGAAGHGQLSLLDPAAPRRERLSHAVDRLTARFGEGAVRPATIEARRRGRPDAR